MTCGGTGAEGTGSGEVAKKGQSRRVERERFPKAPGEVNIEREGGGLPILPSLQLIWEKKLPLWGHPGGGTPRSQAPGTPFSLHPAIPAWARQQPRTHCSQSRLSGPGSRPRHRIGNWPGCRCGWRGRQTGRGHRCLQGPWWLHGGRKGGGGGGLNILCTRSHYQLPFRDGSGGPARPSIQDQIFPKPRPGL